MSERHGTVCWTELMTREPDVARGYYGAVCGWTFQAMGPGDVASGYLIAMAHGKPVAGLMDIGAAEMPAGVPDGWFTYIAVDDIDHAVAATEERGGSVVRRPWTIPGVGRVAIVVDPSGAAIGLMTPEGDWKENA